MGYSFGDGNNMKKSEWVGQFLLQLLFHSIIICQGWGDILV